MIPQELQKHGSPDIVMALVGNKADLLDRREIPAEVSYCNRRLICCILYLNCVFDLLIGLYTMVYEGGNRIRREEWDVLY